MSAPAVGRRERTKAANRAAILAAARDVFAEEGYGAVSVRDIVRRTDLASGTFYNYFPDKDAIFRALVMDAGEEARRRVRAARRRALTAQDFVEGAYRAFFEFIIEDPEWFAFMRRNLDTLRTRFGDDVLPASTDELAEDLRAAIAAGHVPPVDVDYCAHAMVAVGARAGRAAGRARPARRRRRDPLRRGAVPRGARYAQRLTDALDRRGPAAVLAGDHLHEHVVVRAPAAGGGRGDGGGGRRVAPRAHRLQRLGPLGGGVARELRAPARRGGGRRGGQRAGVGVHRPGGALAERGERVVCAQGDFTSVLFPLLAAEARGVQVELVPLERVAEAIDADTALVAVSAVQSADGRVADLDAIAAAAAHHGARTYIDASQAAGWLPIDAARFDHVAAVGYKYLLGPRGCAFMAVRPEAAERLTPVFPGWYAGEVPLATRLRRAAAARTQRAPVRPLTGLAVLGRPGARARAARAGRDPGGAGARRGAREPLPRRPRDGGERLRDRAGAARRRRQGPAGRRRRS